MKMLVLAATRSSLEAIFGMVALYRPACSSSPAAAMKYLKSDKPDVILLDPEEWSDETFRHLVDVLAGCKSELVYFSDLRAPNIGRAVAMASRRPIHVVLRGADDEAKALRAALDKAKARSIPAGLLAAAAPRLAFLPQSLQAHSVGLFGSARIPRWVDEVHEGTGVGRRSIDRWMLRAGMPSVAVVHDIARLARAWHLIADDRVPLAKVTEQLGYRRSRTFTDHMRRYLGVSPTAIGKELKTKDALQRLRAELVPAE